MMRLNLYLCLSLGLSTPIFCAEKVDLGAPYGNAVLIDAIDCGADPDPQHFKQYPEGISRVDNIYNRPTRVLPNEQDQMHYMAWRLGAGKGLKAGSAYLIKVYYPEDVPRSMYLLNRGNETGRGFATGAAVADCLTGRYVNNSPESLQYPLSGTFQEWETYFHLHDRFPAFKTLREGDTTRTESPEDGFWFVVAQHKKTNAPLSHGAAVARIELYEVPETEYVDIHYPPEELPRRYIFCREEMADVAARVPHGADEPLKRAVDNPIDWFEYKARYMRFLGMNTYSKDLLEFSHNQGWESDPEKGNNEWYVQSSAPDRWQRILKMLSAYDLYVLPMYEYGGSTGENSYGREKDFLTLSGEQEYTWIKWLENNPHADITDPRTLEELKKIFYLTIVRHKNTAPFLGAWLRPRPVQMPINFSDRALARFAEETAAAESPTREQLRSDKDLLDRYYTWWFKKRHAMVDSLARYLRQELGEEAIVLYTSDASEPGRPLPGTSVVTDDPETWKPIVANNDKLKRLRSFDEVVSENLHGGALLSPVSTWGKWEMNHASPRPDPQNYKDQPGALQTMTYHRLYSVSNPQTFDAFRGKSGLAIVRHYSLNENEMEKQLGYFVSDVERNGPYSMLAEARAMAYGDPRYIGYLIGNTLTRGFPFYVREFNAAFLSLPAVPSQVLNGVSSDPEIIVRQYQTEAHGSWLAIINTSLQHKKNISVNIPAHQSLRNAATDEALDIPGNEYACDMYPGQLISLHLGNP